MSPSSHKLSPSFTYHPEHHHNTTRTNRYHHPIKTFTLRYIALIVATVVGVAFTAPVESSTGIVDSDRPVSYPKTIWPNHIDHSILKQDTVKTSSSVNNTRPIHG
ncbi:hypothetical protein K456DRAFT_31910 [Colletotrichum gloeosporioides 23]|nr:hypothetical protein K456DRAFT_31910 [Colletotrichum gloeosporioides 23]